MTESSALTPGGRQAETTGETGKTGETEAKERPPGVRAVIRAVIFDLDGTLIEAPLDFDALRGELGVEGPLLEAIEALTGEARRRAEAALTRHEDSASRRSRPVEGSRDVLRRLRARGVKTAILTRNSRRSLETAVRTHDLRVDALRSRDDGPSKPSPAPVLEICRQLGVAPAETLVVGDYVFDVDAANAAGAISVYLLGDDGAPGPPGARRTIRRLAEVLELAD